MTLNNINVAGWSMTDLVVTRALGLAEPSAVSIQDAPRQSEHQETVRRPTPTHYQHVI